MPSILPRIRERWQQTRAALLLSDPTRRDADHTARAVLSVPIEEDPPMERPAPSEHRYLEPGWFTRNVFNRAVRRLTLMGVSVLGSRELRVRGRTSGEWRSTPV